MSSAEVMALFVRSALVELARDSLERDPANAAALRGLLAEADRARVEGDVVDVLRSALALIGA